MKIIYHSYYELYHLTLSQVRINVNPIGSSNVYMQSWLVKQIFFLEIWQNCTFIIDIVVQLILLYTEKINNLFLLLAKLLYVAMRTQNTWFIKFKYIKHWVNGNNPVLIICWVDFWNVEYLCLIAIHTCILK